MPINFWMLEQRKPPSPDDIKDAIKKAQKLPDAGDHGHVASVFPIENQALPAVPEGSWNKASLKTVKLKNLYATNQQLDRKNLVWHLKNPGMSRFQGRFATHIQVIKMKSGDFAIVDGHHRASALSMLNVKRDAMWVLKEKDL